MELAKYLNEINPKITKYTQDRTGQDSIGEEPKQL